MNNIDTTETMRDALSRLEREDIRVLYEQYSEWARHLHTLVWVAASFGVGVSLGGITLFERLNRLQFTAIGVACLIILYICHLLAEGNRAQCMNHWEFLNVVESYWGIRDWEANPQGPLTGFLPNQRPRRTRFARVTLMWACAAAWILAIALKLIM
jgi:hypothetical protein